MEANQVCYLEKLKKAAAVFQLRLCGQRARWHTMAMGRGQFGTDAWFF
jgi:hypothetical protein